VGKFNCGCGLDLVVVNSMGCVMLICVHWVNMGKSDVYLL
jgi:hypothetical protein